MTDQPATLTATTIPRQGEAAAAHCSFMTDFSTALITALPHPRPCIAYVRVSTERQQEEDQALDRQSALLRDAMGNTPYQPAFIYADIGSARGEGNIEAREEFLQAWQEAHRSKRPLMVVSASRLSRHLESFQRLMDKMPVEVVVLDQGGVVSREDLFRLVQEAEKNGDRIVEGTARYVASRIAAGKPHGSKKSQVKAGKASGAARAQARDEKIEQLIDILDTHPDLLAAREPVVRKWLNDAGILAPRGRPWTYDALAKKLSAARQELLERRQMQAEVDAEPYDPGVSQRSGQDITSGDVPAGDTQGGPRRKRPSLASPSVLSTLLPASVSDYIGMCRRNAPHGLRRHGFSNPDKRLASNLGAKTGSPAERRRGPLEARVAAASPSRSDARTDALGRLWRAQAVSRPPP